MLSSFFVPPLQLTQENESHLSALVLLRWLALAWQFLCLLLAWRLQFLAPTQMPVLGLLWLLLGVYNVGACRRLHVKRTLWQRERALLVGLLGDWMQFIALLSLTGGIQNPFYPLIYVHAVLGAILLPFSRGMALLSIMGVSLYLLNPVVHIFNNQQTFVRLSALVAWGIQFGVLLAVWALAAWTSRRMLNWRQRAESLSLQQQRLQRVHLLGALGAGVAHEFATPLNTLRLRLQRLERQSAESPDLQAALRALAQCERRLKSLADLPSAEDLSQLEPLVLTPYLQQLIYRWRRHWPECELEFENRLTLDFALALPELLMRQALLNLLDNAAQAMKGQGKMKMRVQCVERHLEICIQDTGPGWPESVRQHLGEPFITTRPDGTGLGLYTVFMLAQALEGQLHLRQINPQGAEASLCLPIFPLQNSNDL